MIALDDVNRAGVAVLALQSRPTWQARRRLEPARAEGRDGEILTAGIGPVLAVAGIADPSRFLADLRGGGWTLAGERRYRDHHRYSRGDVAAIFAAARGAGARAVVTTEKDLVRLLPFRPFPLPVAYVPLALELDSVATFDAWLCERLGAARAS